MGLLTNIRNFLSGITSDDDEKKRQNFFSAPKLPSFNQVRPSFNLPSVQAPSFNNLRNLGSNIFNRSANFVLNQPVRLPTTQLPFTNRQALNTALDFTVRPIARTGFEATSTLLGNQKAYKPVGTGAKVLFGSEPLRNFNDPKRPAQQLVRQFGVTGDQANRFAMPLIALGAVTSVVPPAKGGKIVSQAGRTQIQKTLSEALKKGASKPVEFGQMSVKKFNELNRQLMLSGAKPLESRKLLIHPSVIKKLAEKRINLDKMTPDQVADIAFSAIHNTKSKVISSKYPQVKTFLKPKGETANTAFVGGFRGEGSVKSVYIKDLKDLKRNVPGGGGNPPSGITTDVANLTPQTTKFSAGQNTNIIPQTRNISLRGLKAQQKLSQKGQARMELPEVSGLSQKSLKPTNIVPEMSGGGVFDEPVQPLLKKLPGQSSSLSKIVPQDKYSFNVNKDKMKLSLKEKQVLDTTVKAIKPELQQIKGKPLKNSEVVQAARRSDILQKVTTREETLQAEAALLKARQRLAQLDKNLTNTLKTGNQAQAQAQMKDLIDSLRVVSSNAADAGRRLQSLSVQAGDDSVRVSILKDIAKVEGSTNKILAEAQNVDWNNANSIAAFYRKFIKPTVGEILDEFRYNNMLSSPKTQLRNAFSNLIQTFVTRPLTLTAEGRPIEAAKYLKGAASNFPNAIDEFVKAFKGESALAQPDIRHIPTGKLPKFLTIPTRLLEAGDRFFTALIKGGEMRRGIGAEKAEKTAAYFLLRSITESDYDRFYQSFREQISELDTQLSMLQEAEDNYYITAKYLLELANRAYELFKSSEVEERRQLIKLVLSNLRVEGNLVQYDAIKPFDTVLNYSDHQLWHAESFLIGTF